MATRTLSQKVFDIVGDDPDSFDEAKESRVNDLLMPINHEMPIESIKWKERKSAW
jgi:hypothetical protein